MANKTWKEWLRGFGMSSLRLTTGFLETEILLESGDRDAAWDLYVELVTRITTQPLPRESGVERAALASVYGLFAVTRETLKAHGRGCQRFARLAVVILNQRVRPFTAKWHRLAEEGALEQDASREQFREELGVLQQDLRRYSAMLADLADVEDLTSSP